MATTSLRTVYFTAYNTTLALVWVYIFVLTGWTLLISGPARVYQEVASFVQFAQTAALMELVHTLVGLTRSPFLSTLAQSAGRMFCVWGVMWAVPDVQQDVWVSSLFLCWSSADAVRYLFFAFKEVNGSPPYILLWLRYSLFIALYPPGILSELGLAFHALPIMKERHIGYIDMPNRLNFALDYFLLTCFLLSLYIPGAPYMYTYMLGQRKKMLGKTKNS